MPVYEFRCDRCGPFEHRRDYRQSEMPMTCPRCGDTARRVFSIPALRTAGGPFARAGAEVRARYDRSRTGEPIVSGAPTGRRLNRPTHRH